MSSSPRTGSSTSASAGPRTRWAQPWAMAAFTALLLAVGAWLIPTAWTELRAEFPSLSAQDRARRWTEGTAPLPTEAAWRKTVDQLHASERIRPESPVLQELLGSLYLLGAQQEWQPEEQRRAWAQQSVAHYRHSLRLRPTDGLTWALLASVLADIEAPAAEVAQAINRAMTLSPNDNHTQLALLQLALRHWERIPPELQTWAERLFEEGTAAQRQQMNRLAEFYGLEFSSEVPPR